MNRAGSRRIVALGIALMLVCAAGAVPVAAQAPQQGSDPFAQSQMQELAAAPAALGGTQFSVSGFVDAGMIVITQSGPLVAGGDIGWAFGNSQFTYFSETSTFTLNEVDLTLDAQRQGSGKLYGARASIDFYPSRDTEAYTIAGSDKEMDVDEGFVFVEFQRAWNTRLILGRAPGFVTLEQSEGDAPDLRLIGHTYVFQAGGGYPYGFQAITRPGAGFSLKFGLSNGGVGAYSFFPGDTSTLNAPTARDADNSSGSDQVDGRAAYAAIDWLAFDEPAGSGTLRLGVAAASASELTYNTLKSQPEPYSFSNVYAGYRVGSWELRLEAASLEAYYELSGMGHFEADMAYLLVSFFAGADHLITLRAETISYLSDIDPTTEGSASKSGATYRYRLDDGVVLKLEAVREKQSPQFFTITAQQDLTTDVVAMSWVYSF